MNKVHCEIIKKKAKRKTKKKSKELKTGDKCTESGCKGRIALMTREIENADMDQEPYKNGIREGNNDEMQIETIEIGIHACDECGKVYSKWFE
jgi:hypothetical protein